MFEQFLEISFVLALRTAVESVADVVCGLEVRGTFGVLLYVFVVVGFEVGVSRYEGEG